MTVARRLAAAARDPRARAIVLALAGAAIVAARAPVVPRYDFCTYYAAGSFARAGEPAAAYDLGRLLERHQEFHPGPRGLGPFLYSPLWLAPAALFTRAPVLEADRLNRRLGLACLAAGLAFVLLRLGGLADQLLVAGAFALSHPSLVQLVYGNWTFLLFALAAAAWWLGSHGRVAPAALAWALALHLKLYLGAALLALAVAGRRALAARAVLVAAALALAALAGLGLDAHRGFLGALERASGREPTAFYNQLSLEATAARFATEPREWLAPRPGRRPLAAGATIALGAAGLVALGVGLAALRRAPEAALAYAVAWTLLFVPLVWDHSEILLFLVLPAVGRRHRLLLAALLAASVAYQPYLRPLLDASLRGEAAPGAVRALLLYFPSLNLLALAASLAAGRARPGREAGEA